MFYRTTLGQKGGDTMFKTMLAYAKHLLASTLTVVFAAVPGGV